MTAVEPLYAEIGILLMCHRHAHDLTQEQMANLLGLTRTSVANIETGRQRFMLHTLVLIAGVLGTEPGPLLTEALDRVQRKKKRRLSLQRPTPVSDTGGPSK